MVVLARETAAEIEVIGSMTRRASKYSRRGKLTLLVASAVSALAVISACSGDDNLSPTDTDASTAEPDATSADVTASDATRDGSESCAVDAGPLDPAQVALGLSLVTSHGCYGCHGGDLSGNNDGVPSTNADGGVAYPPNLTSDPVTGLGCWTNAQIENAILHGIDNEGDQLCNPMPLFGSLDGSAGLGASDAVAIVAYLRSLQITVNQVPDTPICFAVDSGAPETDGGATDAGADAEVDASDDAADASDGD